MLSLYLLYGISIYIIDIQNVNKTLISFWFKIFFSDSKLFLHLIRDKREYIKVLHTAINNTEKI